ncbi:hypothetical protein BDF14DRAFT_589270 [Spinellus fusiger]|nr:hypothetical protein BDF14DRAFT_589270 [Spinellus fusiger]
MAAYWYSTDGTDQRRLSGRHLSMLDEAFEHQKRVELYDSEAFGPNIIATACPHLGTMTAGLIHFGLYRQPSLWSSCDGSLDTLVLMSCEDTTKQGKGALFNDWYENSYGLLDMPPVEMSDATHNPVDTIGRSLGHSTPNPHPPSLFSQYQSVPSRSRSHLHDSSYVCCVIS